VYDPDIDVETHALKMLVDRLRLVRELVYGAYLTETPMSAMK
jgi:hypothetical protein